MRDEREAIDEAAPRVRAAFVPGDGLLAIGHGAALYLPFPDEIDGVNEIVAGVLRGATTITSISNAMLSASGTELTRFGFVDLHPDSAAVLVRGDIALHVELPATGERIVVDGSGYSTWQERPFPSGLAGVHYGDPAPTSAFSLEGIGVVPVSSWHIDVTTSTQPQRDHRNAEVLEGEADPPASSDPPAERGASLTARPVPTTTIPLEQFQTLVDPSEIDPSSLAIARILHAEHAGPSASNAEPISDSAGGVAGDDAQPIDTFTVAGRGLAELRAQLAASDANNRRPERGVEARGRRCAVGHLNPPTETSCVTCDAPISSDAPIETGPRPALGVLRFDDGRSIVIDGPMLIGRTPPAGQVVGAELAAAISVPDSERRVSKVHLELRIDGWEVAVVDRESRNHTWVTLPDRAPIMLRPLQPMPIVQGTVVDLGHSVTFTYRAEP